MVFKYELTEDDYRDAMSAHVTHGARVAQRRYLIAAAALGFCAALYLVPSFILNPPPPTSSLADDAADMIARLRGFLVPAAFVGFLGKLRRLQGKPTAWLWTAVVVLVYMVLFCVPALLKLPAAPDLFDLFRALDPSIPWILFAIFIAAVSIAAHRRSIRASWDAQPNLRAAKTVTLQPEGIRFASALVSTDYRWLAFRRVVETKAVLLLYVGDIAFQMIPRRAVTTEEYAQLRGLLREHVETRLNAFPVLPAPVAASPPDLAT